MEVPFRELGTLGLAGRGTGLGGNLKFCLRSQVSIQMGPLVLQLDELHFGA